MHQSAASTVGSPAMPQFGPAHHKGKAPDLPRTPHDPFGKTLPTRVLALDQVLKRKNIAIYSNTIDLQSEYLFLTPHSRICCGDGVDLELNDIYYSDWSGRLWWQLHNAHDLSRVTYNEARGELLSMDGGACHCRTQLVEFAKAILDQVDGPHYTFIDPVLFEDEQAIVEASKRLIVQFEEQGISRDRIIISIPASDAGVLATRQLAKDGILVNLSFVTSLEHAAACAEVEPHSITISVRHILDWCDHDRKRNPVEGDLYQLLAGYHVIQSISTYFRINQIKTRLIATEFRNLSDIALLNDFDAICLPKDHIEALPKTRVRLLPNPDLSAGQLEYPTEYTLNPNFSNNLSTRAQHILVDIFETALDQLFDGMQTYHDITMCCVEHRDWLGLALDEVIDPIWNFDGRPTTHETPKKRKAVQSSMTTRGMAKSSPIQPQMTYELASSDFSNLSTTEIDDFLKRCRQHVTRSPKGTLNGQGTGKLHQ
ncbi:aldolase [Pluteus cervinus]|uniref:Aldolase n=1 Tax=Pluteus cervinus TaxID=181527 RepID=A0ACD3AR56_9AGAR|nr:aldolase [Pluteus cervinus]